jgi:hypothetical protein
MLDVKIRVSPADAQVEGIAQHAAGEVRGTPENTIGSGRQVVERVRIGVVEVELRALGELPVERREQTVVVRSRLVRVIHVIHVLGIEADPERH